MISKKEHKGLFWSDETVLNPDDDDSIYTNLYMG